MTETVCWDQLQYCALISEMSSSFPGGKGSSMLKTHSEDGSPPYCPARGDDSEMKVFTLWFGIMERSALQIRPP